MSLDEIYRKTRVLKLSLKHMKISTGNLFRHLTCRMFRLILKKNFLHFNGKHYLQTHGTAMGAKTAVSIPLPTFSWHILKQGL